MNMVFCGGCGLGFDRSQPGSECISGKWYHEGCAKIQHEKRELYAHICKYFNLKAPGPVNYSLIKKYRENNGYSYVGMTNALKYFFDVQKRKPMRSNERIGIIPHIYDAAQAYFLAHPEQKENEGVNDSAAEPKKLPMTTIEVKFTHQTKDEKEKQSDDLNSLFDEE